ncbi:MAG: hypothetical protein JRI96_04370 [Deltaproteobacteria bacterium]|nr:hypothetical protein [Deltaproteobacteria bacterium]
MIRVRAIAVSLLFVVFLAVGTTYAGPVVCDGELVESTRKASGKLLVAIGFAYSAIGFIEAGQPENIHHLWELTQPVTKAREAAELFKEFSKLPLLANFSSLDNQVLTADYKKLYSEFKEKGIILPYSSWAQVSSVARKGGVRGLMGV